MGGSGGGPGIGLAERFTYLSRIGDGNTEPSGLGLEMHLTMELANRIAHRGLM